MDYDIVVIRASCVQDISTQITCKFFCFFNPDSAASQAMTSTPIITTALPCSTCSTTYRVHHPPDAGDDCFPLFTNDRLHPSWGTSKVCSRAACLDVVHEIPPSIPSYDASERTSGLCWACHKEVDCEKRIRKVLVSHRDKTEQVDKSFR